MIRILRFKGFRIQVKITSEYKKFVYWITGPEEGRLREEMKSLQIKMTVYIIKHAAVYYSLD